MRPPWPMHVPAWGAVAGACAGSGLSCGPEALCHRSGSGLGEVGSGPGPMGWWRTSPCCSSSLASSSTLSSGGGKKGPPAAGLRGGVAPGLHSVVLEGAVLRAVPPSWRPRGRARHDPLSEETGRVGSGPPAAVRGGGATRAMTRGPPILVTGAAMAKSSCIGLQIASPAVVQLSGLEVACSPPPARWCRWPRP